MSELKLQAKEKSPWNTLHQLPFKTSCSSHLIKINETEFLAASCAPSKSAGLYVYNIDSQAWVLYFKYPNKLALVPGPMSMHDASNELYIYNVANDSVIIFNLKKQVMMEYFPKFTGNKKLSVHSSAIINGQYNLICSNSNCHHLIWNKHANKLIVVHRQIMKGGIAGHGLVHIKSQHTLLLFVGSRKNHQQIFSYYSINEAKWRHVQRYADYKCSNLVGVLTNDEKHIVLFPTGTRVIDIVNLNTMKSQRTQIQVPKGAGSKCKAIIVNDEIHLIKKKGKKHWKISLKRVFQSKTRMDPPPQPIIPSILSQQLKSEMEIKELKKQLEVQQETLDALKKSTEQLKVLNVNLIDEKTEMEQKLPVCIICYEDTMNYAVEPCHHLFCKKCATTCKECPKCRTTITSSFQVYD
eukprot:283645_1